MISTTSYHSFLIYGSGTFARQIGQSVIDSGNHISGFVDHMNLGNVIRIGKTTFTVQDLKSFVSSPADKIAIGVCNLHGDLHEIQKRIECVFGGMAEVLSPVKLYKHLGISAPNYWLVNDFDIYENDSKRIDDFRTLLVSLESRKLYDDIIRYRIEGEIETLPTPVPLTNQYLALDLGTPPNKIYAVDAGACRGENLESFVQSGITFGSYYAFEPDMVNLQEMIKAVGRLRLQNFLFLPLAIWSKPEILSFSSVGNASSSLKSQGEIPIQGIDIDLFLGESTYVNFIKMDIEGAERNALLGASRTISIQRPHLAISVYHKPQDLWDLGLLIEEMAPGQYDFHLRMYGHQTFDTILYAIPKK